MWNIRRTTCVFISISIALIRCWRKTIPVVPLSVKNFVPTLWKILLLRLRLLTTIIRNLPILIACRILAIRIAEKLRSTFSPSWYSITKVLTICWPVPPTDGASSCIMRMVSWQSAVLPRRLSVCRWTSRKSMLRTKMLSKYHCLRVLVIMMLIVWKPVVTSSIVLQATTTTCWMIPPVSIRKRYQETFSNGVERSIRWSWRSLPVSSRTIRTYRHLLEMSCLTICMILANRKLMLLTRTISVKTSSLRALWSLLHRRNMLSIIMEKMVTTIRRWAITRSQRSILFMTKPSISPSWRMRLAQAKMHSASTSIPTTHV